jgi:hypothetical protein
MEGSFVRSFLFRTFLAATTACLTITVLVSTDGNASAVPRKGSPSITCKQLTSAQIQPLMNGTIKGVKVTPGLQHGQHCVFSGGSDGAQDVDVLVDQGSFAVSSVKQDITEFKGKVVVPGVGDKAYREKGDFSIDALKGDKICTVSVGSAEDIPGVGAIENANGNSSDIGEANNAVLATALGTVCNRIFGSGNTKISLTGLAPYTSTATSS